MEVASEELGVKRYWVIVENEAGCRDTAYIDVNVMPPPSVSITGDTTICIGQASLLSVEDKSNPDYEFPIYLWSTGETTREITITQSGTYYVEVTDSNGCRG